MRRIGILRGGRWMRKVAFQQIKRADGFMQPEKMIWED